MGQIAGYPRVDHKDAADYTWVLPVVLLVMIVAGAIGSLLAGLASPDLIGADGLDSVSLLAP